MKTPNQIQGLIKNGTSKGDVQTKKHYLFSGKYLLSVMVCVYAADRWMPALLSRESRPNVQRWLQGNPCDTWNTNSLGGSACTSRLCRVMHRFDFIWEPIVWLHTDFSELFQSSHSAVSSLNTHTDRWNVFVLGPFVTRCRSNSQRPTATRVFV